MSPSFPLGRVFPQLPPVGISLHGALYQASDFDCCIFDAGLSTTQFNRSLIDSLVLAARYKNLTVILVLQLSHGLAEFTDHDACVLILHHYVGVRARIGVRFISVFPHIHFEIRRTARFTIFCIETDPLADGATPLDPLLAVLLNNELDLFKLLNRTLYKHVSLRRVLFTLSSGDLYLRSRLLLQFLDRLATFSDQDTDTLIGDLNQVSIWIRWTVGGHH